MPSDAPADVILKFLKAFAPEGRWLSATWAQGEHDDPADTYLTTATFAELVRADRLTVRIFKLDRFAGNLDGVPVTYVHNPYGYTPRGAREITLAGFPTCPLCGYDLRADGYPLRHQHRDTGYQCPFVGDD